MSRGLPEQVSATAGGAGSLPTGGANLRSLVSADGRWSVFVSSAPNLAPGQVDVNSNNDVFLYDRVNDAVTLVSHANGAPDTAGNGASFVPSISADGRWIAFGSEATNLSPGQTDTNNTRDVFLYDRDTGAITLISRTGASATTTGNSYSDDALISADGSGVVYTSAAQNLMAGQSDFNNAYDVFYWSRATGTNTLVSHITSAVTGAQFNTVSNEPVISADGEWVAFTSTATDLAPGVSDFSGFKDVFLWNRTNNTNQLVSHSTTSAFFVGNNSAERPRISADGSTVLFFGMASNYVNGYADGNNSLDLFLFSRATGAITLVSHTATSSTTTGNRPVTEAALSADGNWAALVSEATNYVSGQVDTTSTPDVFLFNRANGTLSLVSRRAGTTTTASGNAGSSTWSLQVSDNGSFVAYQSSGFDLVPDQSDSNPGYDLFVFDRAAGTNALLSGAAASANTTGDGVVQAAGMSGDGRWFLFAGLGTNHIAGSDDLNGAADIFLADRVSRTIGLVSRRDADLPSLSANGDSAVLDVVPSLVPTPAVSGDGRYTVFQSTARNLVPGQADGNGGLDIFLYDQSTGETVLVSRAHGSTATAGNAASRTPVISTDGRWVAFVSRATNLIASQSDSLGTDDVFLWDRLTGNMALVSRSRLGTAIAVGSSTAPLVTADGAHVVFLSTISAGTFVSGGADSLNTTDAFSWARDTGAITVVSRSSGSSTQGAGGITQAFLSSDGRYVGLVSTSSSMLINQNDTANTPDLYQWDRTTGAVVLASHSATALNTAIAVTAPAMSADGNYMVFSTRSTTVVSGVTDTNNAADLYLWTRSTNLNRLVSRSGSSPATTGNGAAEGAAISADGRYVAYLSRASNMIVGGTDSNGGADVFLYDRTTLTNSLVSHTPASVQAASSSGGSPTVAISADGTRVAFVSIATNLVNGQTDIAVTQDLFLYDVATTQVTLASHRTHSATAGLVLGCDGGALSTNGRVAVFQSTDPSLVSGDFNGRQDVFLWTDDAGTDLAIAKTNGASSVVPGQTVTYLITATNAGPQAAGATVTDSFPAALQGATWTCAAGGGATCGAASGAGALAQPVNLPVNGTVTFTVTATVSPDATGSLANTASITPGGGVTDSNPANNSATDTDTLTPQANLLILVNDAPDPVDRGATLTYTILMTNEGPSTASSVTVTDTLPAGTTFLGASGSGWTCGHAGGVVTCTRPSQAPSPTVPPITIQVAAPVAGLSTLTNTASISAATPDPVANNTASAVTAVSQPSILVGPEGVRTTTEAGGMASFSVVLGSAPLAPVTVSFVSSNPAEGTVVPGSVTFTPSDWSSAQLVTVQGVDDPYDDGDVAFTILTSVSSADPGYAGIDPTDVPVTNQDDDTASFGLSASPTGMITSEAGDAITLTLYVTSQPRADVTVALTSSNPAEGTVSPASVTFTPQDWNGPRSITVTGVDDAYDDGDVEYTITFGAAVSADPGYAGIDPTDVPVTNQDDDTAGIAVTAAEGLTTTEAGDTATFTVVLNARPRADVIIPLVSSTTEEGTVEPEALTFTTDTWSTPQTVTVTGVDDDYDDGDWPYTIALRPAESTDAIWAGMDAVDVALTNEDDDTAGLAITPVEGLTTTEAGGTATFTMALTARPRADVVFSLTSSNTGEGTVEPASLTFTPDNWNAPQTVTVTGVDDLYDDGETAFTITPSVDFSMDPGYREIALSSVTVTNQDDDTAGFAVAPATGLTTTEAGGTATFTVALTSRPRADVTVSVTSSDTAEGTATPATLTFTADTWNAPQTVTLTGVDDAYDDGNVDYTVALGGVVSTDALYAAIDPADVTATNQDDDSSGITVTPTEGLTTTEAGGTATFTVVLNARPRADVIIPLVSSTTEEGTVEPESLTFTTDTWSTPQTVTITGVDDDYDDGDVESTITTGAAVSTDAAWAGVDAADVTFTNEDDDTASIEVTPTEGLITTEGGGTATFTVALKARPTADVAIALESSDAGEGQPSPATLTFTTDDWSTPQTVTVTGQDDDSRDGDADYTITLQPAQSADAAFAGLDPADVTATNRDDNYEGVFYTVTPCRLVDTRQPGYGPALQNNQVAIAQVHGACGIPSTARAVAMNLTFTGAGQPGTVLVYPGDLAQPPVDEYLWIRAGNVSLSLSTIMKLGADGTLAIHPKLKAPKLNPTVHIVLDVTGYFE